MLMYFKSRLPKANEELGTALLKITIGKAKIESVSVVLCQQYSSPKHSDTTSYDKITIYSYEFVFSTLESGNYII